jgi:hypothetical protein
MKLSAGTRLSPYEILSPLVSIEIRGLREGNRTLSSAASAGLRRSTAKACPTLRTVSKYHWPPAPTPSIAHFSGLHSSSASQTTNFFMPARSRETVRRVSSPEPSSANRSGFRVVRFRIADSRAHFPALSHGQVARDPSRFLRLSSDRRWRVARCVRVLGPSELDATIRR